jgi:hypothetical protein
MRRLEKLARRRALAVGLAVTAAVGISLAVAAPAAAAGTDRYVAVTGDNSDNDCTDPAAPCITIQYAVSQADAGDTIHVGSGVYAETVDIRMPLTLTGAGATGASATHVTGSGGNPGIIVDGTDTETVPDVAIENLDVSDVSDADGIEITDAIVDLRDSTVTDNDEDGIDAVGARSGVTVTDSTVESNALEGVQVDDGAAVHVVGSRIADNDEGGVIVEAGSATVATSTIDANTGAGIVADGPDTSVTITDTTVSGTRPFSDQEGEAYGAGILVFATSHATITRSTLDGNTGQGVLISAGGAAAVSASTITGTLPGESDDLPSAAIGVDVDEGLSSSVTLTATIIADNTAPNCAGPVTDGGYNLSDTTSCGFSATGSLSEADAALGALADNGGPTLTRLPAKAGAAIDRIPSGTAGCSAGATDQRGEPALQGPACDIGAVEVAQPPLVVTPSSLPHGTVGQHYSATLHATGGLGAPYEFALADGSALPDGLTLSPDGVISGTPTAAGTTSFTVAVDDPTFVPLTIVVEASTGPAELAESGVTAPAAGMLGVGGLALLAGATLLALVAVRRRHRVGDRAESAGR